MWNNSQALYESVRLDKLNSLSQMNRFKNRELTKWYKENQSNIYSTNSQFYYS